VAVTTGVDVGLAAVGDDLRPPPKWEGERTGASRGTLKRSWSCELGERKFLLPENVDECGIHRAGRSCRKEKQGD